MDYRCLTLKSHRSGRFLSDPNQKAGCRKCNFHSVFNTYIDKYVHAIDKYEHDHGQRFLERVYELNQIIVPFEMTRTAVYNDYNHPQPGETPTLTLDEKVAWEISKNGIKRPKGYTVSYHANPEVEKMHFGPKHPMKPWRLTLTNKIVLAYGMHEAMDVYLPRAATFQEMTEYHNEEYIDFLSK